VIPAVRRLGSGPLLVCHPGGPGLAGDELADLGGLSATRELVLVDPRGTGATPAPADPAEYRIDDYLGDLEELRADLGLETFDLLGFSHGGIVAMAYAATHPDRVRKLVLASTLAAFTPELAEAGERMKETKAGEPWYDAALAALAQEEAGAYETAEEATAMWLAMAPIYFSRWDERYGDVIDVTLEPAPLKAFNAQPFDVRPLLPEIEAETLVITGRDDFICGPAAAETIVAGVRRAEVALIGGAGHMTFLEQPEAFSSTVERFLSAS
jgi:pimeloyl-ACP methyl ester carboxylesterase